MGRAAGASASTGGAAAAHPEAARFPAVPAAAALKSELRSRPDRDPRRSDPSRPRTTAPTALLGPALDAGAAGSVAVAIADTLLARPLNFSLPSPAATRAAAVLRTPTVWEDRPAVVVAVQLSSSAGHTAIQRSGLSLWLELQSAEGYRVTAVCTAGPTGLATCRCDVRCPGLAPPPTQLQLQWCRRAMRAQRLSPCASPSAS